MSRLIALCGLLVLLTVVVAIPRISNDFEPAITFDLVPDIQQPFQLSSFGPSSAWQSIFGNRFAYDIEDTSDVKDLFSSSQFAVVATTGGKVEEVLTYTIGKRVPNDRRVSRGIDGGQWDIPVNISITLKYPSSGEGAKVTCAEFTVNQGSKIGQAKVIAGGIGQRSITILLEAKNTTYFNYQGIIYGI